jgi:pyruvate carboxylase subunit B
MKYFVQLSGRTVEIQVDGDQVLVDGKAWTAHLSPVPGTPLRHLLLGELSYTFAMESRAQGSWSVGFRGARADVEVIDERTRHIRSLTGETASKARAATLIAPMPGLVVRVHVTEGQTVTAAQPLLALEAMKMENELRALAPGKVKSVRVQPGQAVEKGQILLDFDPVT